MKTFNLPDLGEGLPDAEISQWHVEEGQTIEVDQLLVAMETAKAIVDVPSPQKGKVIKLHGAPGDVIKTGSPLVEFEEATAEVRKDTGTVAGQLEESNRILEEKVIIGSQQAANKSAVKASPAVRKWAKDAQIDLTTVTPTGPNQTITLDDIKKTMDQPPSGFEPLTGVRRQMAKTMVQIHRTVVPVTVTEDANLFHWAEKEDITVRLMQAIVAGCQTEPALNAWYHDDSYARKLITSVNLGIAVDTEDGLFVPVIRDIASKSADILRQELNHLRTEVSNRTISPADLKDPSFILSNFGKFSGRYATPVVVPPTVGILGVGKLREAVVAKEGSPVVCQSLPLALTIDHRACTGGEATRFLGAVVSSLESNKGL